MPKSKPNKKPQIQLSVNLNLDTEDIDQIKKLSDGLDTSIDDFCSNLVQLALGYVDKTVFIAKESHRWEQDKARKIIGYYTDIQKLRLERDKLIRKNKTLRNYLK